MDNLQDYLTKTVAADRAERMKNSDQLTLGEMILMIEPLLKDQERIKEKYDSEVEVVFDFEYLYPTGIGSWRGSYSELALQFSGEGGRMTVTDFYKMLKETLGKTFTGWKGGEFTMSKTTPVWVANSGNAGNTAVIDIVNNEYQIIIITGYREF